MWTYFESIYCPIKWPIFCDQGLSKLQILTLYFILMVLFLLTFDVSWLDILGWNCWRKVNEILNKLINLHKWSIAQKINMYPSETSDLTEGLIYQTNNIIPKFKDALYALNKWKCNMFTRFLKFFREQSYLGGNSN